KDSSAELEAEREAIARQFLSHIKPELQVTSAMVKQDFRRAEAKGITYPTTAEVNAKPHPRAEVRDAPAQAGPRVPRRREGAPTAVSSDVLAAQGKLHAAAASPQAYTGAQVTTPLGGYNPPLVTKAGEKVSDLERRVLALMHSRGARAAATALTTEDLYKPLSVTHSVIAFALVEMERKGLVESVDKKRFWIHAGS
ncbi:MAG TPA: hypothetical protein VGR28_11270, partial [Candidatus Thermoplasmatota archaeon]|nr:hypothetical protein [Candidatus Thermoplasmatota archaeon]